MEIHKEKVLMREREYGKKINKKGLMKEGKYGNIKRKSS